MKTENEIINEHLVHAASVSYHNVSAVVRVRTLYQRTVSKPDDNDRPDIIKSGFHANALNFDIEYDFDYALHKIVTSYF